MVTRRPLKGNRLNRILDAALAEFEEKGYEQVTMYAISRRSGLNATGVYKYFASKDALLEVVHDRLFEPVRVLMQRTNDAPDALAGLRRFLREYLHYWASHPHELEYRLIGTARRVRQGALWSDSHAHAASLITWYDTLLWRAIHEGTLVKHDPRDRATALYCAVEGALPYLAMQKSTAVKKIAARIEQVFLEAVIADDALLTTGKRKSRKLSPSSVSALMEQVREVKRQMNERERERKKQAAPKPAAR